MLEWSLNPLQHRSSSPRSCHPSPLLLLQRTFKKKTSSNQIQAPLQTGHALSALRNPDAHSPWWSLSLSLSLHPLRHGSSSSPRFCYTTLLYYCYSRGLLQKRRQINLKFLYKPAVLGCGWKPWCTSSAPAVRPLSLCYPIPQCPKLQDLFATGSSQAPASEFSSLTTMPSLPILLFLALPHPISVSCSPNPRNRPCHHPQLFLPSLPPSLPRWSLSLISGQHPHYCLPQFKITKNNCVSIIHSINHSARSSAITNSPDIK